MSIKNRFFIFILIVIPSLAVVVYKQSHIYKPLSKNYNRSQFTSKGMADRIIEVQIKSEDVSLNTEKNTIVAEVKMPFDFEGSLYYRWKLDENVKLITGQLSGQVNGLKKAEPQILTIQVTGFSKQNNHNIGFEIMGSKNGRAILGESIIASDKENTFENTVQNVEKIKASQ